MAYDSNFEDEIALDGSDAFEDAPVSTQKVEFEGFKKAASKAERRRERRRRRNERTGKIAAGVLLLCIMIIIILAVVFVDETEHFLYGESLETLTDTPTMSPTVAKPTLPTSPSPTIAPKPTLSMLTLSPTGPRTAAPIAAPTESPTITQAPTSVMRDSYVFEPIADTYLHLNGPHKSKIHGREETLSVQRGDKDSTPPGQEITLPTIVSLIEFDTTKEFGNSTALPKRSRWPEAGNQVKVMLRIYQIPKDSSNNEADELSVDDILPVNVEVYRLPNNHNMEIERLTGEGFQNAPKSVTEGILIAQQSVEATDTILDIDVTSALFLSEVAIGYGDEQVLLLLKVYWEDAASAKDFFRSRESDDGSPQLIFSNMISEDT
mmetsp:Transcript_10843/g.26045  ORF Transcript_10843/g.26045 Transcript_10843/m.26045 type:complete len:378 (-) Transcript_10843:1209-2342(-)